MSGVAITRSNSMKPPWMRSTSSSAPTMSAPAAVASAALASLAMTATRTSRPVPEGRLTTPRTCWSAWRGSTPRLMAISIDSSNLAVAFAFTSLTASSTEWAALRSPVQALMRFACLLIGLAHHFQAHGARRAFDNLGRRVEIVGVQVFHLLFGDFAQLGAGHLAGHRAARLF